MPGGPLPLVRNSTPVRSVRSAIARLYCQLDSSGRYAQVSPSSRLKCGPRSVIAKSLRRPSGYATPRPCRSSLTRPSTCLVQVLPASRERYTPSTSTPAHTSCGSVRSNRICVTRVEPTAGQLVAIDADTSVQVRPASSERNSFAGRVPASITFVSWGDWTTDQIGRSSSTDGKCSQLFSAGCQRYRPSSVPANRRLPPAGWVVSENTRHSPYSPALKRRSNVSPRSSLDQTDIPMVPTCRARLTTVLLPSPAYAPQSRHGQPRTRTGPTVPRRPPPAYERTVTPGVTPPARSVTPQAGSVTPTSRECLLHGSITRFRIRPGT